MVKRCQWGLCNSDSRYPERLEGGVKFIPFPKPRRTKDKCLRWIKLCGRPHDQLNVNIVDGNRHLFVCTKHFIEGEPTERYPDPVPAIPTAQVPATQTPARKSPTRRALSELPKKRRKVLADVLSVENTTQENIIEDDVRVNSPEHPDYKDCSALDLLAQTAENQHLREQVARLVLENEHLKREQGKKLEPSQQVKRNSFSVEEVKNSHITGSFVYYTGFRYERFIDIFKFLVGTDKELPFTPTKSVKSFKSMLLEDQLLLTMMKLRQNFDYKHLAGLFFISPQDASLIFTNWIIICFFSLDPCQCGHTER